MDLVLVRHGQPLWVEDGRGVLDPALTALGRRQAERLAETWPEADRPTRLWVSSARRARETAAPLAERFALEPEIHPGLVELKLPAAFEGAPAAQVGKIIHAARHRGPEAWWQGPEGREPFADFHARVTETLEHALAQVGLRAPSREPTEVGPGWRLRDPRWTQTAPELDERVVFVGHGGTNAVVATHLLGFDPTPWIWETFLTSHTGVTRLKARRLMGARVFGLKTHGELAHLEPADFSY